MHKPFKTIDEQIDLLENEKGLIINSKEYAKYCLSNLNYYRISGYSLTLKKCDKFANNISFEDIMQIYNFDRELKLLLLTYLEDIEISLRTHIAYELGKQDTDPNAHISYMGSNNFISESHYNRFLDDIRADIEHCKEEAFIKHHKRKYGSLLPSWVLVETLSFGKISKFFSSLSVPLQKSISENYYNNIRYTALNNLFEGLVILRNICAHHSRLYNRGISLKPDFSTKEINYLIKQRYESGQIGSSLFFRLLVIIRLSPLPNIKEDIITNIKQLCGKYPFVDLRYYGFKPNWIEIIDTLYNFYGSDNQSPHK